MTAIHGKMDEDPSQDPDPNSQNIDSLPAEDPLQRRLLDLQQEKDKLVLEKQIRVLQDEVDRLKENNPIKRFIKGLNDEGYWNSIDGLTTLAFILSLIMTFLGTLNGNVNGTQAVIINAVMGIISTLGTIITNKGAPSGILPNYTSISAKTEDETNNKSEGC